jgi:hypothetical protein
MRRERASMGADFRTHGKPEEAYLGGQTAEHGPAVSSAAGRLVARVISGHDGLGREGPQGRRGGVPPPGRLRRDIGVDLGLQRPGDLLERLPPGSGHKVALAQVAAAPLDAPLGRAPPRAARSAARMRSGSRAHGSARRATVPVAAPGARPPYYRERKGLDSWS